MLDWRDSLPPSAGDALERPLRDDPARLALVASDARMTYHELDTATDGAAAALHDRGVRRGDVVAVSLPNTTAVVVTFYAVLRLGAVWLGINRNLAPPEKQYILDDAHAALLVTEDEDVARDHSSTARLLVTRALAAQWQEATGAPYPRVRPRAGDAAGIAYTSGTTGRPKGVVHSHHNVLLPGAVLTATRGYGPSLRKGDCAALTILNMQVTSTLLAAQAGGTQIVMDRVDPSGVASWIREEAVNTWFAVPTLLRGLTRAADVAIEDLQSLTEVWTGGTFLAEAVRDAFEARFDKRVFATYGLTEAPTMVTMEERTGHARSESSGTALPHLVVEIRDDTGAVLPVGETGEITVRAATTGPWKNAYRPMLEYLGQPSATAATVQDGVLHTGDIGQLDATGNLVVRDRRHSLILRGGANVYPAEVERVLLQLDGVNGASVVGVDDERLGQRIAAAVELEPGIDLDAAALVAHCAGHLARYKVPEQWRICTLPRNAMGKVVRTDVEHWFATGGGR
jgi:long-chain acyl-CoA synthetase